MAEIRCPNCNEVVGEFDEPTDYMIANALYWHVISCPEMTEEQRKTQAESLQKTMDAEEIKTYHVTVNIEDDIRTFDNYNDAMAEFTHLTRNEYASLGVPSYLAIKKGVIIRMMKEDGDGCNTILESWDARTEEQRLFYSDEEEEE